MPRRGFIPKREVLPDPVYGTAIVTKLINQIMYDGKRGVAQNVCYEAFEMIAQKTGKEAIEVFNAAMNNIMPSLECKARRVPPIRCLSRSAPSVVRLWRCAGWFCSPASAVSAAWPSVWPARSSMPPTTQATP